MEKIEVIKQVIINNLKANLELLSSLGNDVDIEEAKISILESIQKYVTFELSNYKRYTQATITEKQSSSNSQPELSEEEIELQAQSILEHIQKYGSINTLMPIPKEVLKVVNRKLDDISSYTTPKLLSQSENQEHSESIPTITTTISSTVLDEANERLKQIKETTSNDDYKIDEQESEIVVEPLNPKQASQREEHIEMLVKHYLEYGKLNQSLPIPPDVLEEVTRRIVRQRLEVKETISMKK